MSDSRNRSKNLDVEAMRSNPDMIVYKPGFEGEASRDNGNEHFLVFEAPNGDLLAMWTQSTYEGAGDHRIVLARSKDNGITWGSPKKIVGPDRPGDGFMASWGFPLVSASGRIYCIYNQYKGMDDTLHQFTGTMEGCYSDDNGETWSIPGEIEMQRSAMDHPDRKMPPNWIVWQKPQKDALGRWIAGFTRWTSAAVRPKPPIEHWVGWDCAVEFIRFDNIHENPEISNIRISFLQNGGGAIRVPFPGHAGVSVAQEPSFVVLPDQRLFVTMRTITGHIWYSISEDNGENWCAPEILRDRDFGEPLLQPISCCPIYAMEDGRFLLLYHHNARNYETIYAKMHGNRQPAYIALGAYRKNARQPIWFSKPKKLLDNNDVPMGPRERTEIGVYTSFTEYHGKKILWYPDRKFFLLGKYIADEWLMDLKVPE